MVSLTGIHLWDTLSSAVSDVSPTFNEGLDDDGPEPVSGTPPLHPNQPHDPWANVRTRPPKPSQSGEATYKTARSTAKKKILLERISQGETVEAACAAAGVSEKGYQYYRRTDVQFKATVNVMRGQLRKEKPQWTGDSASFSETFFPKEHPTPAFHYDIKARLKNAKPGTITLINVFPNSGKTAVIEDHICETLALDPNHRFVIASKAINHAKKILGTVQDRMTNMAAYPEFIGRFGPFYCVDDKTEALTQRGWLRGDEITTDDTILSMDQTTGELAWSPVHSMFARHYDGPMYRVKGQRVDALVTPGHSIPLTDGRLVKIEELGQREQLRTMGTAVPDAEEIYSDAFVEIVGWAVTEGHYVKRDDRPNCSTIAIAQKNGTDTCEQIQFALKRAGAQWHEYDGGVDNIIHYFGLTGLLSRQVRQVAPNRVMTTEFLMSLSRTQRLLLVDVMIAADGSTSKSSGHRCFVQKCSDATDAFVTLCTLAGIQTRVTRRKDQSVFCVDLHQSRTQRSESLESLPNPERKGVQRPQEQYSGLVWCPTTDHGTFIARRNGLVFATGNTDNQERGGKPWTREYIKVFKCDSGERDYSVQVMGWSGTILGSRVDTIILDDIQTGDNLNQIDEMLRKFRQDFYTRLKGGRIIIIGNRIAVGDIYERLMALDVIEPQNHIDLGAINARGESLWPDRWPLEELAQTRKMVGDAIWWTMYQQMPQLASNATFSDDLLEGAKDWNCKVGVKNPGDPCVLAIDTGLDPGICAIVAFTYDREEMRLIDAEAHGGFVQQEDILALIESFTIRYNPQHVVIETVHYQRALERDERLQQMARKYGFETHPHSTNRNKIDPVMGVAAMAGSFIREEIKIPWKDSVSETRMEPVMAELAAWRPNVPTRLIKQDFVMAMWFAWLFILNARHGMGIRSDAWQRQGLPYGMTRAPRVLARVG